MALSIAMASGWPAGPMTPDEVRGLTLGQARAILADRTERARRARMKRSAAEAAPRRRR